MRSVMLMVLAVLLYSTCARALQCQVTMAKIMVSAAPGTVAHRVFALTLDAKEQTTHFRGRTEDWWPNEEDGASNYLPSGMLKHSCAAWVKLDPVEAAVDPGARLDVHVTISIPPDAKPGGYWCALCVSEVPNPLAIKTDTPALHCWASFATGIFVNVTPVQMKASIIDMDVTAQEARVRVRNDGDCPLNVQGTVEFLRPGAVAPVAVVELRRRMVVTEPVAKGVLVAPLPDAARLPDGHYLVRTILDIGVDAYLGVQKAIDLTRPAPAAGDKGGHG